jgi:hypothetical protein
MIGNRGIYNKGIFLLFFSQIFFGILGLSLRARSGILRLKMAILIVQYFYDGCLLALP